MARDFFCLVKLHSNYDSRGGGVKMTVLMTVGGGVYGNKTHKLGEKYLI